MTNRSIRLLFAACSLLVILHVDVRADDDRFTPPVRLRRPVAMVVRGGRAFVANRASGTISTIDLVNENVVGETQIGERLSALVALPTNDGLLALDELKHRLILLEIDVKGMRVVQRLTVPQTPVELTLSNDGKTCAVASLWSRRVTLIDIAQSKLEAQAQESIVAALTLRKTLDLPFAPRMLRFLDNDARLLVADAFGGKLAVIDIGTGHVASRPAIVGHNIRGLALAYGGRELHVTHQLLDGNITTTHEHVFWGGVMKNFVRSIPLDQLFTLSKPASLLDGSTYPLGHPSGATGDPGAMLVTSRGEAALLLSGVNEVALRRRPREPFVRRKVGRRPTGLALSDNQQTLYVVNTFDDSISTIDLTTLKVTGSISLGPQPELTPAQRGEHLFFNARLSLDGWYSCHSCHTDGHTNGLLNDNFGDSYFGDPKRIPSLLGVGRTHPWAWNGKTASLANQITKSITVTMQGEKPSAQTVNDLTAYLKTLQPPPGIATARGIVEAEQLTVGRKLFQQNGCINCHTPPNYSSNAVYDVGLTDKSGNRQFNPPSLLGVSQRAPYFHDGRAKTLRDVFTTYHHNLDTPLSEADLRELLLFLKRL